KLACNWEPLFARCHWPSRASYSARLSVVHFRHHILVDMTPLEPRGRNGGAGLVATSLVRHLSSLASDWRFTLYTDASTHAELEVLDAPNVQRTCVTARARTRGMARRLVDRALPAQVRVKLKETYWALN